MLRALEIFWLSLSIFSLVAIGAALYLGASNEALFLAVVALVSAVKYFQRRRQRRRAGSGQA